MLAPTSDVALPFFYVLHVFVFFLFLPIFLLTSFPCDWPIEPDMTKTTIKLLSYPFLFPQIVYPSHYSLFCHPSHPLCTGHYNGKQLLQCYVSAGDNIYCSVQYAMAGCQIV